MNEIAVKILLFLVGSLVGGGFGFLLACFGATGIIKEKNNLKTELESVKAERDELRRKEVKVVEITDPTVGRNVKFGGF